MKRFIWGIVTGVALLVMGAFLLGRFAFPNTGLAPLPKPEKSQKSELIWLSGDLITLPDMRMRFLQ